MFLFHRHAHTQKCTHRHRTCYTNALYTELFTESSATAAAGETQTRACLSHAPQLPGKTLALFSIACSRATSARNISFCRPPLHCCPPCPRLLSLLEMNGTDPLCSPLSPELVLPGDGSATSRSPFSSLTDVKTGPSKFHAHHCSPVPALLSHLLARDLDFISLAGAHLIL